MTTLSASDLPLHKREDPHAHDAEHVTANTAPVTLHNVTARMARYVRLTVARRDFPGITY